MIVCPKCGNENDVCLGQKACFRCGAELPDEPREQQPSVPDSTQVASSMNDPKKRSWWFAKLTSKEEALSLVKNASIGFWAIAGIQGLIGVFYMPSVIADAVVMAVLAAILFRWRSRVAAVLLLLMSTLILAVTILNKVGMTDQGGRNIVLAVIFFWAAVRAVEATFKLHGRFKDETQIAA
jgi:hypothetical protein